MIKQVFDLNKERMHKIKKELIYLLILFFIGMAVFKIGFYNENVLNIIKIVSSLFWLFLLPGYFLMLYFEDNLDFIERLIIGIALGFGIMGILSYYIGLLGLNIKYHTVILPITLIFIGAIVGLKSKGLKV